MNLFRTSFKHLLLLSIVLWCSNSNFNMRCWHTMHVWGLGRGHVTWFLKLARFYLPSKFLWWKTKPRKCIYLPVRTVLSTRDWFTIWKMNIISLGFAIGQPNTLFMACHIHTVTKNVLQFVYSLYRQSAIWHLHLCYNQFLLEAWFIYETCSHGKEYR